MFQVKEPLVFCSNFPKDLQKKGHADSSGLRAVTPQFVHNHDLLIVNSAVSYHERPVFVPMRKLIFTQVYGPDITHLCDESLGFSCHLQLLCSLSAGILAQMEMDVNAFKRISGVVTMSFPSTFL